MATRLSGLVRSVSMVALSLHAVTTASVPANGQSVRDSAGVQIVSNTRPLWTDATSWRLRATPSVDIGVVDGRAEYELHDVMGAIRLSSGTIVVANMSTSNLRYYDASGRFLFAAGRKGEGPAEFRQLMGVFSIGGDTVIGHNAELGWESFTSAGKHAVSVRFGPAADTRSATMLFPVLWLADGSAIAQSQAFASGPLNKPPGAQWTDSMSLVHVSRTGKTTDRLPALPAGISIAGARGSMQVQFSPRSAIATDGQKLFFAFGNEYAYRVMSPAGTVERIVRRSWTPRPVGDAERKAFMADYTNPNRETIEPGQPASGIRALRLQNIEAMSFASTLPAIGGLLVDAARNVWVRDSYVADYFAQGGWAQVPDSATQWSVFDPSGRWLGTVTMPRRFRAYQIDRDAVLGLFRDDEDVEHVRLYLIEKSRR